ncbi:MAG TPA: hypothetical protein VLV83_11560 [Acidobacteriota bacterium]|nr:hypothetical protein [Acidobacteriota bacterium]
MKRRKMKIRLLPKRIDSIVNDAEIQRIQAAFARAGYEVTEEQAFLFWREYSRALSASWLSLSPSDIDNAIQECASWFESI